MKYGVWKFEAGKYRQVKSGLTQEGARRAARAFQGTVNGDGRTHYVVRPD